jgi:hypothetical protein
MRSSDCYMVLLDYFKRKIAKMTTTLWKGYYFFRKMETVLIETPISVLTDTLYVDHAPPVKGSLLVKL